jgi:glycerol-3-phosphate dehydrogenase
MQTYQTQVVVIGAGAVGSAITRELSKYNVDVILIEKNEDIGGDASKSNSATIVSGYDSPPGTLESRLSVASNPLFDKAVKELDVPFERIGAIQVGFSESDVEVLRQNRKKAIANGVFDVELLGGDEVRRLDPVLSKEIKAGLFIPREGIINVFELLVAYVENAVANGVRLFTSTRAKEITAENGQVKSVITDDSEIFTEYVINAAAVHGDEIAKTVGLCDFRNYPRKGEFFVLDKNLPYKPNHIIAPIPTPLTRGKLLTPSIDGNLLVGPTAVNLVDKDDHSTSAEGLAEILREVRKMIPEINPRDSVTQFAGLRPARDPAEYSIRAFKSLHGYVEVNGISQGVSCSLATGVYVTELLSDEGLCLIRKDNFNPCRRVITRFAESTRKEQERLVRQNPKYGNIICRCETISEAEILEAISRGARSMDAIKRRLRVGMGRCQGGFCGPRIVDILARQLNLPAESIRKNEPGSELLACKNK